MQFKKTLVAATSTRYRDGAHGLVITIRRNKSASLLPVVRRQDRRTLE